MMMMYEDVSSSQVMKRVRPDVQTVTESFPEYVQLAYQAAVDSQNLFHQHLKDHCLVNPYAPCMEYLPTFTIRSISLSQM